MIPVTVMVMTLNEAARIRDCLGALQAFNEIIVVDSGSRDGTVNIAAENGARIVHFDWNGKYPKKRQWALDNIKTANDWVFFVDADEIVLPDLVREMAALFESVPLCAGYFIKGRYVRGGRIMRFGLANEKLALLDKTRMMFPVVDDLDCPGMGEIEGHYQPVLRVGKENEKTGRLRHCLLHVAYDDEKAWRERHERYAEWEVCVSVLQAWPEDPNPWRQWLKEIFRSLPFRPQAAFIHSYILKAGFLDGVNGYKMARDRYSYYATIQRLSRDQN